MATPELRYARTADGVSIAYASWGTGPCLMHLPGVLTGNDLRGFAATPNGSRWLTLLARRLHIVLYDSRGCGSSGQGVEDYSLDGLMEDIDAVADAAGITQFHVFGMNHGGPLAIAYAATRPQRVRSLVLWSTTLGGASFERSAPARARRALREADEGLLGEFISRSHLGLEEDARQDWEHVRRSRSDEAVRALSTRTPGWVDLDASPLAGSVRAPTLVVHPSDVPLTPLAWGQEIASAVPGARFKVHAGHLQPVYAKGNAVAVADALTSFVLEVEKSVAPSHLRRHAGDRRAPSTAGITPREMDVLRLLAEGLPNARIADVLSVSRGTVARHVSNLLPKIGCANRTEAARWAVEHGLTRHAPD